MIVDPDAATLATYQQKVADYQAQRAEWGFVKRLTIY